MLPLIEAGQTDSLEFHNLHKYYMMIASLEAVILLIAAFAYGVTAIYGFNFVGP